MILLSIWDGVLISFLKSINPLDRHTSKSVTVVSTVPDLRSPSSSRVTPPFGRYQIILLDDSQWLDVQDVVV